MRPRYFLLAVIFGLLATIGFIALRGDRVSKKPSTFSASVPAPAQSHDRGAISPILPSATATPDSHVVLPPPMLSEEIARVVKANSIPGRMVFVEFAFSSDGAIRTTRASGAAGRAKPGAMQHGPGYLQFEVYAPNGERTLAGSVEDPLHQRLEYEDENQSGKLRATMLDRSEGLLDFRLPGEADAARIVFFRETASTATDNVSREPAGEIVLR